MSLKLADNFNLGMGTMWPSNRYLSSFNRTSGIASPPGLCNSLTKVQNEQLPRDILSLYGNEAAYISSIPLHSLKELNGEELDLAVFTIDMEDYRYEPLSDGHAIRLAVIHPGQIEDILEVSLFTVQFIVDNPPQYEALSYCWGSAQNPHAITTATPGLPDKGNLRVTQNLAVALRHLRFQDQSHTIWIDAICINQSDSVEKGSQVAMMGDIYRLATSVVVWLGPQADNSDRAMQIMNFLGQQVEVNFVYVQMKPSTNTEYQDVADESTNLLLSADDFCSIYRLFSRQWFERLLVRQEIFLANPSAYVLCGLSYVPWLTFRKSWYCIHSKPHPGFRFSYELEDRMELLRAFLFQKTRINLFDLRVNLGTAKCQDPRDRIYAVLRMLNEPYGALNIVPDYNKTAVEIYTEVTVAYLKRFQDASILNECQPSPGASGPSWVPDWSVEDNTLNYWGVCYASGPITTWWSLPEPGVLRMADGVVEDDSRDNAQVVETYARTLCLDMFEDFIPMSSLPTFAGSVGSLRRIISGILSLAPASARVGDEICILLGLDSPILLRPAKGGRYLVVGVCYLSSAQFGESILGKLPKGVRLTNSWNERSNQWKEVSKIVRPGGSSTKMQGYRWWLEITSSHSLGTGQAEMRNKELRDA
ncbi:uncharacterized protein PAC_04103 [Phialocephala subalpina]|uniref:Heterokaryon incompatibility domain-containing protein n=1 Tax=Phialocephala subalpina TaxID=576137 RepID=A0A1L7WN68_9HELO|nr:uncharacterized protein PAC_04103 [Phialocephala subalpina]